MPSGSIQAIPLPALLDMVKQAPYRFNAIWFDSSYSATARNSPPCVQRVFQCHLVRFKLFRHLEADKANRRCLSSFNAIWFDSSYSAQFG